MAVRNRGSRKNPHWHYDFMLRRKRYRGAIKEARTQEEADQAERQEWQKVFEKKVRQSFSR